MPTSSRLAEDWTLKFQVFDNALSRQWVLLTNDVADDRIIDLPGSLSVNVNTDWIGNTNRVSQLNFATLGQSGGDDVFGNVTRHIGRTTIDFGRVFTAECSATVASPATVSVDDDLSTGQTTVTVRATDLELAGWVDVISHIALDQFRR